jgi:hypothetical protein
MILTAHAWASLPFRRLLDLVDVAFVTADCDRSELDAVARSWGMSRMWNASVAASDALFGDAQLPASLRLWGRSLVEVRDRTVLETHVRRVAAPFWALPWPLAAAESMRAVMESVIPAPTDSWPNKLGRTRESLRSRHVSSERHTDRLGAGARHDPRFRRLR